ncbi:MAG: NB-ARC domain-containing protein [Promethearchaeota archaeon]
MHTQESYLNLIEKLLVKNGILSISGPSGSGKTTLAQFIMGHLLTTDVSLEESCIWVQASEYFSNKRLETIFKDSRSKIHYLKQNVYVIPSNVPCSNFVEQELVLHKIINHKSILPPSLKFIVIDNISHHLRFELSRASTIRDKSTLINGFFDSLLSPLIMKCQREKIYLILIHEISYVPELRQEKPFLNKLYERICSVNVNLSNDIISKRKSMNISINLEGINENFEYELCNSGLVFC